MPSVKLTLRLMVPVLVLLLGSCAARSGEDSAPAAQAQTIQTIQPGDGQLTCDELLSEMRRMDRIAYASPAAADNSNTAVSALTSGAGVGFGFIPIPIVGTALGAMTGPVAALAGNAGQQKVAEQQNRIAQAQQRKQHLVMMYDNKKCYESGPASE
jgi:hypothetical protein